MPTRQTHLVWADITRIIAILLVIVLHTFSVSEMSVSENVLTIVLRVVAKVCVPLFIMLSGALLLSKEESWSVFFHKRLRRVVVPWLFWTMVILVLFRTNDLDHPISFVLEFKRLFSAEFTFLPLIFSLYLLIPPLQILVKYGQKKYVLYLLGLWFLAISCLPYLRNSLAFPLAVDNGLVTQTVKFSGYLLAGWWLSKEKLKHKITWIGLCTLGVVMASWSSWLVITSGDPNSVFSAYTSPWVVVLSMSIFVMLVNFEGYFNRLKPVLKETLHFLSRISFGVFLIHTFVKQVIQPLLSSLPTDVTHDALLWFWVTLLSFGVIAALSRVKFLGRIVT